LFNLRTDPYERADITSNTYWDWFFDQREAGPASGNPTPAPSGDLLN
jgi:hypothetical protein